MAEHLSPLDPVLKIGRYPNSSGKTGVMLSETAPGSIVQLAAWPDTVEKIRQKIATVAKLKLGGEPGAGALSKNSAAFGIAPDRFLLITDDEGLADTLAKTIAATDGTVTDLSHGRTAIRIEGEKAQWVLAKLFAVDFAVEKFPVSNGIATSHHDIFAHIQRRDETAFEIYLPRSLARAFWKALIRAAEETGYEVG